MTIFSAIQMNSTENYGLNLSKALSFIQEASESGAKVISLPEMFNYIGRLENNVYKNQEKNNELVNLLGETAKKHKIYLLAGSIHELVDNLEKTYNTSFLFSPDGQILKKYRKIHLFDALLNSSAKYKESDSYIAGDASQLPVIETEYGKFGMTICYDLRFPELFRKISVDGAQIIFVPSAFSSTTGREHWEVLLRARAIENQVYIVASDQFGFHDTHKESFGNSMIIDPWGKVISRASEREEVIYANIDLNYLKEIRTKLPVFSHRKVIN